MRALLTFLMLAGLGGGLACAEDVPKSVQTPLPRPRPPMAAPPTEPHSFREAAGPDFDSAAVSDKPTPCDERLAAMADFTPMPRLIGPNACGGADMIEISAVVMPDKHRVAVAPTALLNCRMAESLAAWVRDEAWPRAAALGSALAKIENYDSYECRPRNRQPGAKLSEHAHGDALDIRAFRLADGRRLELTDIHVDKPMRVALRDSACRRFTTVLGPGQPYHEGHIHLDTIERRNGYRICQWDVREPPPPKPAEPKVAGAKIAEPKAPEPKVVEASNAPAPPKSGERPAAAPPDAPQVQLATLDVPLPRPRPAVVSHHRRKSRGGVHFPFNIFR